MGKLKNNPMRIPLREERLVQGAMGLYAYDVDARTYERPTLELYPYRPHPDANKAPTIWTVTIYAVVDRSNELGVEMESFRTTPSARRLQGSHPSEWPIGEGEDAVRKWQRKYQASLDAWLRDEVTQWIEEYEMKLGFYL